MSRTITLLLSGALLVGLSFLVQEPDPDQALERAARRLQQMLSHDAGDLQATATELALGLESQGPREWMRAHAHDLESKRHRTGSVFLGYQGDSLVCWSGQPFLHPERLMRDTAAHIRPTDGTWLHARATAGGSTIHALRPVWHTPPMENAHLERGFHPSLGMPKGLTATHEAGPGPVLRDAQNAVMIRLQWRDGALEVGPWLHLRLAMLVLAFALIFTAWWRISMRYVSAGRPWMGILVFLSGLLAFRAVLLARMPAAPFDRLSLFDPAVYATSPAFASMGDLLINAILLLLGAAFLRAALRRGGILPRGHFFAFLATGGVLLLAGWVTRILAGVVDDSSIDLDPYHVQGLGGFSLLALAAMVLLLAAWLLASGAMAGALLAGKRPRDPWLGAAAALAVYIIAHHFLGQKDPVMFLWPVPLMLLYIHGHLRGMRFPHVVIGAALLAAFSAHLLDSRTSEREGRERLALAERLATREDPVVEQLFREMAPRLRRDRSVYAMLASGRPCGPGDLDRYVRQRFFGGYWERYDVRLFAFAPDGQVVCATDKEPPRSFAGMRSVFTDPAAIADTPDLFIEEQPGRSPFYHARVAVMPDDLQPPGQLIVELYPRSAAQGLGFPTLLLAGDDPLARRTERYNYARYENGQLVERSGTYAHPLRWSRGIDNNGHIWYDDGGSRHLAKGDPEGTLIVLSRPEGGLLDRLTLFSYLFALFSVVLTLVVVARGLWKARGIPALGIGAKVRIALVLFAIAGLVFFGLGTQRLLARQFEQRFESAILEKARSVHQELQQKLDGEPTLNATHIPYLEHLLARMSNVFFTDITVYTTGGRMLASSRPQIFAAGLLGRQMDPVAYERIVLSGISVFVHEEAIGTAAYRAAYIPLRDRNGRVLAHIALPGFADQSQREQERADVIVAVVNLFVLLFALSVLVAVFISNWTTRPLDLLKNALGRVALQGANEPIRYRGDDEIGQLVEVYNRKVEELRDSAERLARSERESAWREMARQVAHEIKNPLTPMKLSIQHFQRTWAPDAPGAEEKLERFSTGLVEQIDALSGIAGAFSNFAEMPRARAEDLDLAEVAEAALSLFHATPGIRCTLERTATGPMPVHADREQLLRTFNNLLKNAVQSIPDGREGRIKVLLRCVGGEAIAEVHDNGSGIAEADMDRIFRPNFTTKSSGMGLGLAMVQRMVETAGGRVWFETAEGEGSTFYVALPLRKA